MGRFEKGAIGTLYAKPRAMDEDVQKGDQARLLEWLREQLVGKGIVVDKRLLWSEEDGRPNGDLIQIKSRQVENEAQA